MAKTAEPIRRFVILDADRSKYDRFLGETVHLCRTADEISKVYAEYLPRLTWISCARKYTDELLKAATRFRSRPPHSPSRRDECVLMMAPPRLESVPALHGLFSHIVGDSPSYRWLPKEELIEVLLDPAEDSSDLIVAAAVDPLTKTLSLVCGDCRQLVVPFALFPPSGDGTKPDFSKLRLTDYGRTIAFGTYEAATDAILYETDAEYRNKVNRQRQESDRSFGASLLRLRKQRRLGRSDFAPLSAKTIARIERNEIDRPHGKTLQTIADRLGVLPEEISTY